MKALMWIIGIISCIFLGWIAKDIIFSMIEITPETTLGDIQNYEYAIHSTITGIIIFIIGRSCSNSYCSTFYYSWITFSYWNCNSL